jgi:hypothetical protein
VTNRGWWTAAAIIAVANVVAFVAGLAVASESISGKSVFSWAPPLIGLALGAAAITLLGIRLRLWLNPFLLGSALAIASSGSLVLGLAIGDPGDPCRFEDCFPMGDPVEVYLAFWLLYSSITATVSISAGVLAGALSPRISR